MDFYRIYSDRELSDKIRKLQVLGCEWKYTTARKDHEDSFGVKIKSGDVYFSKNGLAYDDTTRWSIYSMEQVLLGIDSVILDSIGSHFLEEQRKEMRNAVNNLANILEPEK